MSKYLTPHASSHPRLDELREAAQMALTEYICAIKNRNVLLDCFQSPAGAFDRCIDHSHGDYPDADYEAVEIADMLIEEAETKAADLGPVMYSGNCTARVVLNEKCPKCSGDMTMEIWSNGENMTFCEDCNDQE